MNRLLIFISALVAATVIAQPASLERPAATPAVQPPTVHVVQPGDSLIKIGRIYGVRVEDLRRANNLAGDLIVVGRKLIVSSQAAPVTASASTVAASQLAAENQQVRQQLTNVSAQLATAVAKAAELQPALTEAQTRLAVTEAQFNALSAQNAALQQQYAESEKRAEGLAANIAARTNSTEKNVRQLEQQLAALQVKLAEADRQLTNQNLKELEGRMATLNEEMLALRARLNVYETKAIPFSPEELALFRAPAVTNAIAADSHPRPQALPATATLETKAERNLAAGELPQAEAKLLQVVQQDEKETRAFCNLAITQAAQERYAEAEQTIRKALALCPDDAASLAVLGHTLRAQKRNEEAFDILSRAALYKPDDAGIQTLLGVALAEKGLRGQAETAFRKALQINPNQVDAHQNLAIIYLTQQSPSIELARWHYQKSIDAGAPVSPELESRLAAVTQTTTPK
jgi:Flp pilus assembly protein TadD